MKTLEALCRLEKDTSAEFGTEVYIVGGYVRDFLRRKKNKDVDVVVRNITLDNVQKYLSKFGKTKKLTIHNVIGTEPVTFVTFKANGDTLDAEIALVKGLGKWKNKVDAPLKHDSGQRDFTINSMYLPINNLTSKGVIDYWGGKNDITAKQILTIGSAKEKFQKSPIRILRAFSMAARTKYTISNHVKFAISECSPLLSTVSHEAIRAELEEILLCHKPSIYFRSMRKLGVLKVILPELARCYSCKQDKRYHKYNVFDHLVYSCDYTEPDLVLRLAAILHDIGKPAVQKNLDGRVTFHKHEVVGAKEAEIILRRLRFDNKTIAQVIHLVRMHMYHYTRKYTDAGVRRFIVNAGVTKEDIKDIGNFPLFKIRKAERLGNGFKKQEVTQRQLDFEERIVKVFKESSGFTISDLMINGAGIKQVFGLKASPIIGQILNHLLEIITEDPKANEKRILYHCVLNYLLDEKVKNEEDRQTPFNIK